MSEESDRDNYLGVNTYPYNDKKKYPLIAGRIITSMEEHLISCNPRMSYVKPPDKLPDIPTDEDSERSENLDEIMVIVEDITNGKLKQTLKKLSL